MRLCVRCGVQPVVDESSRTGRYYSYCRPCGNAANKRYYQWNKAKIRERFQTGKYRVPVDAMCSDCARHPAVGAGKKATGGGRYRCVTCNRHRGRTRYYRTRERVLARNKRWRETHPEELRARRKQHYLTYHPQIVYQRAKAQAKRRGATEFLSYSEWQELMRETKCHRCGIDLHPSFRQIDHIEPLALGGQHTKDNLVAACANCNMKRCWETIVKYPHLYEPQPLQLKAPNVKRGGSKATTPGQVGRATRRRQR